MDSTDRRDDLAELRTRVEEALAADDVVVEQVRATGTAEHRTVEVVLDRASGTQGVEGGEYLLEVTTAGVDRPLTEPRHFARNVGRLVEVSVDGAAPVTARLKDVTDDDVELAVVRPPAKKGMKAKELPAERVALDRLGPAIVQVEWSPAQQAGDADAAAGEDTAEHTEA